MSSFRVVKLVDPIQLNLAGGLNFQGDYDNTTAYVVGDVVTYNGSSYAATQGTTGNLPTDVSNWQLLAEKGDPLTVNAGTNIDIDVISPTEITVNTVEDDDATLAANSATVIPSQKAVKAYADTKVAGNAAIVGATKTKITYDAKGLVTAGADATTADIADSTDKRYVTDANLTVIGNTSGTNTGDNATNTQYSGLDAAKVNKAGDTMAGNLNMGTNKLIGGTGVTDILKLQSTTGNGTLTSAAIQLLTGNNGGTTALTVLNNGNVGIGTTSPTNPLHVAINTVTNSPIIQAQNINTGGGAVIGIDRANNPRVAGLQYSTAGSINWVTGMVYNAGVAENGYSISTDATLANTKLYVSTAGNVGIGTTTPGAKLQIDTSAATTIGQIIKGASAQTADYLQIRTSGATAGDILAVKSSGRVGIGVSDPQAALEIAGDIETTIGANRKLKLSSATAYWYDLQSTNDDFQIIEASDVNKVRLTIKYPNGNVGIGTTAPSEKLDVSGTVKATGYKSSDGSAGVSGSFTTTDGKTITIKDGLVVSIV